MPKTEMEKATVLAGSLDSEKTKGFLVPLFDIIKSTSKRVKIDFASDKTVKINCISDGRDVIAMLRYDDELFTDFEIEDDDKLCLYDANEFASIVKLFSDEGMEVSYDGKIITLTQDGNTVSYFGSDEGVIKKAPVSFNGEVNWLSEFVWDGEIFAKFNRSMSILDFEHVIVTGKKDKKVVTLCITDKSVKSSSYKLDVDIEDANIDDFKLILPKKTLQSVIDSSVDKFTVQLSKQIISFSGNGEHFKIRYYISPME